LFLQSPARFFSGRCDEPARIRFGIFDLIQKEQQRQHDTLELIASENHVSSAVLEAAGSVLTNKYAEGYPGARYYQGCGYYDQVEQLAIDRAKQMFGCKHANVQTHSGANANSRLSCH